MSKLWLWLGLSILCISAAQAESAPTNSTQAAVPSIHLTPQSKPPSACTRTDGDGLVAMTVRHDLCVCDGERGAWTDMLRGTACLWKAP